MAAVGYGAEGRTQAAGVLESVGDRQLVVTRAPEQEDRTPNAVEVIHSPLATHVRYRVGP